MKKCDIGGQAVLEGVMMRSKTKMAVAVRDMKGNIETTVEDLPGKSGKSIPILRGVTNMIDMMKTGINTLSWSAKVAGESEEEPTAFEQKIAKLTGKKVEDVAVVVGLVLGLGLFVVLFMLLPRLVRQWFDSYIENNIVRNLIEGLIRIIIFVVYLLSVSCMKEIKRVFMYHGAEHKVISCYEHEGEMTPESAAKYSRLHPRCGTSFLLIVMIISILTYAVFDEVLHFGIPWIETWWAGLLLRLILLPLIAGVSYEFLKFAAKYENPFTRALRWPGLQLQRLTTKEPTPDMIEVALISFNMVLADDDPAKRKPPVEEPAEEEIQADEQDDSAAEETES